MRKQRRRFNTPPSSKCVKLPVAGSWTGWPPVSLFSLNIEVQSELVWMRPQTHRVDFLFPFVVQPCFDQIRRKDSAFEKKIMIFLQGVERLIKRTRHRLDLLCLLRRQ